ncbi:hypothetical protein D3C72_2310630 [compost metagenome]
MAKYTSRYAELGFYVNGKFRRFTSGEYRTEDTEEIAVLGTLADATLTEESTEESAVKPATKPRKTTASTSE